VIALIAGIKKKTLLAILQADMFTTLSALSLSIAVERIFHAVRQIAGLSFCVVATEQIGGCE
jgi:hypothetical protein